MSSDTAQLLKEHVNAVADLIKNEKPDRVKPDEKGKDDESA